MAKDEKKDGKADEKTAELSPEEQAAKGKKKKMLIFIIAGVVLTALLGGGAAFFLAGGKKTDAKVGEEVKAEEGHEEKKEGEKKPAEGEKKAEDEKKAEKKEGETKEEGEKKGEGGEKEGEKKEGKKDEKKEAAKKDIGGFGCTMDFKPPFNVNLRNALGSHYMRLEIAVEYPCSDEEAKAELTQRMPQLRDAVISVASNKSREFLLGPDGMDTLRRDLQNRINHFMSRKIKGVYITDILVE